MNEWGLSWKTPDTVCPHQIHFCLLAPLLTAETAVLRHFRITCALSSNMQDDQHGLGAGMVRAWEGWWEGEENIHGFPASNVDTNRGSQEWTSVQ